MDIKELQTKRKSLEKELDTIDKQLAKVHTESVMKIVTEAGFAKVDSLRDTYIKTIDGIDFQVTVHYFGEVTLQILNETVILHDSDYEVTSEKCLNNFKDLITNFKITKAVATITIEAPVFMIKGITDTSTDGLIDTAFENYDIPESLVTQRSLKLL